MSEYVQASIDQSASERNKRSNTTWSRFTRPLFPKLCCGFVEDRKDDISVKFIVFPVAPGQLEDQGPGLFEWAEKLLQAFQLAAFCRRVV